MRFCADAASMRCGLPNAKTHTHILYLVHTVRDGETLRRTSSAKVHPNSEHLMTPRKRAPPKAQQPREPIKIRSYRRSKIMAHANETINSQDNLRSAPSSPTQHSGKSVTTGPEERDQCETPSEDALRSVQGGGVCGGHNMCDPAILAEVFFPVLQDKDSSLGVGSTDPTPDSQVANDLCISPTYQKRGRFLVWPVSLTGEHGPSLPPNTTSAIVDATTSA